MSATMTRNGGRVQLEQSDMRQALTMAKMAIEGFSSAAIEETQQLIKKPGAEVQEEQKRGVAFPGHNKVMATIERQPEMVQENQTDSCLPCQDGQQRIHTLAGGEMAQVHLHHDRRHRGPERHLPPLMTMR